MNLSDLKPRVTNDSYCPDAWQLVFLCPRCQRHEVTVDFWPGQAGQRDGVALGKPIKVRVWRGVSSRRVPSKGDDCYLDLSDLTITPSINREGLGDKCGGWHGFIIHGAIR